MMTVPTSPERRKRPSAIGDFSAARVLQTGANIPTALLRQGQGQATQQYSAEREFSESHVQRKRKRVGYFRNISAVVVG